MPTACTAARPTRWYGKNNGASQGWKGIGAGSSPNDPAGFVAANLGPYGLNCDHYDIEGSESDQAGHPGVRFALNLGAIALKGDQSGPSAAQLGSLYSSLLHISGDKGAGAIHDGRPTRTRTRAPPSGSTTPSTPRPGTTRKSRAGNGARPAARNHKGHEDH